MTNIAKAMKYMDGIGMNYDIMDGKMFIEAWTQDVTDSYQFQVAEEEIDTMAECYDKRNKTKEVAQ
tara:strand:- start:3194 stop:3391 length:198 start_codon:yes stop_codon:yes gene_type:complete